MENTIESFLVTILLTTMLGCTTHVGAKSTAAADQVSVVRGTMPMCVPSWWNVGVE